MTAKEDKTRWFINEHIILGIPDSNISSEAQELIQESINFLDEFIGLSNQSIVAPYLAISALVMVSSIELRNISEKWDNMLEKYEESISDKLLLVNDKLFADFLTTLIKNFGGGI